MKIKQILTPFTEAEHAKVEKWATQESKRLGERVSKTKASRLLAMAGLKAESARKKGEKA